MDKKPHKATLTFAGKQSMEFKDLTDSVVKVPDQARQDSLNKVGNAISAYLKSAKMQLRDAYSHVKDLAPNHLLDQTPVLIAMATDGIIVRFDRERGEQPKDPDKRLLAHAWFEDSLVRLAPLVSQNVVFCYDTEDFESEILTRGPIVSLTAQAPSSSTSQPLAEFRIGVDLPLTARASKSQPSRRPHALLEIRNHFEVHLHGEYLPSEEGKSLSGKFIARTSIQLPVGWEYLQLYSLEEIGSWENIDADSWAERDILAHITTQQFREQQFASLDPNAVTRERFGELLRNFEELLDSSPDREEELHQFLKLHPEMLCPTHIRMWSKLSLGPRDTDFVFREPSNEYLLVEIEKSIDPLFTRKGEIHHKLKHAQGQVLDWQRYLEDNLGYAQHELGLTGISANPKLLIVIGRSEMLDKDNRRILTTIHNQSPKLRIMTYDDILLNARAVIENLVGPIWDTHGKTRVYHIPDR
ncbi:MAG: hypothetical protein BMS9Abin05_2711 [Rhodothermia bacterium]|nr:MAG: hypothetical protein BMS9Abin05_2711 [Rhodothermia bacterium]